MKKLDFISNIEKIHFVGIGGVSMSALAEYLKINGKNVSGSDISGSERTKRLKDMGCEIKIGHKAKNVSNADALVYTSAIDEKCPEIKKAKKKNIPIYSRGEFLGKIINGYKNSVAVSGCHGKTTTSAMIASVMEMAGKDPTVFLGGDHYKFNNLRIGKSNNVIVEACEYKKSFLGISPKIAVVLNIGNDHLDTYHSIDGVIEGFREFLGDSIAVINADDENCKKIHNTSTVTFGIKNRASYYATNIKNQNGTYEFTLNAYAKKYGKIRLKTLGYHNIYNALATCAVCDILGVSFHNVKKGLEEFIGVKRRNEYLGEKKGVKYFADYAHHPEEIRATISAFKQIKEPFITIFQPHTYSRTKLLMQEFVNELKDKCPLIIYKTYPAREEYDKDGSAKTLYQNIKDSGDNGIYYAEDERELFGLIKSLTLNINKVLALGAGDVYEVVKNYLKI